MSARASKPVAPLSLVTPFRKAMLVCLLASSIGPAMAQEAALAPVNLATIEAVSYGPIPPGARLVTQPETQGEMDDTAWRLANDDLAARGYEIANDGSLVFTVATQLVDRLSTDQALGNSGANSAVTDGMQFSSSQQTLLNPNQPIQRSDRVFRVTATVYDRGSGGFVWHGTVERTDTDVEPNAALRAMLPALLDHFGESASGVAVPPLR